MNLQNIFSEIERKDPEIYDRIDTRRNAMRDFAKLSGKAALASLPLALGSMFKKAYGSPTAPSDIIIDTLNFALTLEYLESSFYNQVIASGSVPAGADTNGFTIIKNHEAEHVNFLSTAITAAGGTPVSYMDSDFDFTAKGTFPGWVTKDYATILAMAQTFEDTGVRAYKGQAANLITSNAYLTAALQIHSVEARHAAYIRAVRSANGMLVPAGVTVKPWITLAQSGIDAGTAANTAINQSYAGEDLTTQASVNIVGLDGFTYIDANAASEAFDEPLTKDQVLTIVMPFMN